MKNFLLVFLICTAPMCAQNDAKVFRSTEVDAKPTLTDGMYTLTMFISENFRIPDIRNKKIRIFTSFIIEPDGTMTDEKAFHIDVREYLPTGADVVPIKTEEEKAAEAKLMQEMKAEAVRVLTAFNEKWLPAVTDGKPVRCLYNYPINFQIE